MDLEALERLGRLRDSGVLSEEEFAVQKQRLLDSTEPTETSYAEGLKEPEPRNTVRNLVLVGLVAAALLALGYLLLSNRQDQTVGGSVSNATVNSDGTEASLSQSNSSAPAVQISPNMPKAGHIVTGRCYMDECNFYRLTGKNTVKSAGSEVLISLRLTAGGSEHKNSEGDYSGKGTPIKWGEPYTMYVFCSSRLPATIDSDLGVSVLDFHNGPPGAYEDQASIWQDTCYPNDDWRSEGFEKRHHFPTYDLGDYPEITIKRLNEIFSASADPTAFASPDSF